jgi:RNA polymerase sigma-70 factor (ECF subfamily)
MGGLALDERPLLRSPVPDFADTSPPLAADRDLAVLRDGLVLVAARRLRSIDLAQDAAQETVVRVLAALQESRLAADAPLAPYAYGVLRHVLVDMERAGRRELRAPPATLEVASPGRNPLERLVSLETALRVRRALAALSPAERQLLERCFVEGLRVSEIAAETGEPEGRLRQRKARAFGRLRALLGNIMAAAPKNG